MRSLMMTAVLIVGPLLAATHATDEPEELLPGFFATLRGNPVESRQIRLKCRGPSDLTLPGPSNDPRVEGGTLRVFDTDGVGGDQTFTLPIANWTGGGNGYDYSDPPGVTGACRRVRVRRSGASRGVYARCRGTAAEPVTLVPPFAGDMGVVLRIGTDSKDYCCTFGGTLLRHTSRLDIRKQAPAPAACAVAPCCGPERITLETGPAALRMAGFEWQIPAGGHIIIDSAAASGAPQCEHGAVIPPGGFQLPNFDLPELGHCGSVIPLGCESGSGAGAGRLWDGRGAAGAAMTIVDKVADTSDGACNPPGQPCTTGAGGAGANTLGDVLPTFDPSSDAGLRTRLDLKLMVITWLDTGCSPASDPGCCATATFNPADADEDVADKFFVLTLTTGLATASFAPLNGDGCERVGSGFGPESPNGPVSVSGSPAAGPCCTVGQSLELAGAGTVFSNRDWLFDIDYDLGYSLRIPATVSTCGVPAADSCTVTSDMCLQ
jgi:hypothetical protein